MKHCDKKIGVKNCMKYLGVQTDEFEAAHADVLTEYFNCHQHGKVCLVQ